MRDGPATRTEPQRQAIREAAYYRWERAGCPDGDDMKFWLEAERDLFGRGPDDVQEASKESFPASDAPAWIPVTGTGALSS